MAVPYRLCTATNLYCCYHLLAPVWFFPYLAVIHELKPNVFHVFRGYTSVPSWPPKDAEVPHKGPRTTESLLKYLSLTATVLYLWLPNEFWSAQIFKSHHYCNTSTLMSQSLKFLHVITRRSRDCLNETQSCALQKVKENSWLADHFHPYLRSVKVLHLFTHVVPGG